ELSDYFTRFVEPREVRDDLLDDFAGFFNSFYAEPGEFPDHEARLTGWLQLVDSCPDAAKKEAYQRYYLDHCVPFEFRRRLPQQPQQAGKLLPAVLEAVLKDNADTNHPRGASPEPAGADGGTGALYQLAGVRLAEDEDALPLRSVWKRLPWLVWGLGA